MSAATVLEDTASTRLPMGREMPFLFAPMEKRDLSFPGTLMKINSCLTGLNWVTCFSKSQCWSGQGITCWLLRCVETCPLELKVMSILFCVVENGGRIILQWKICILLVGVGCGWVLGKLTNYWKSLLHILVRVGGGSGVKARQHAI